MAIIAFSGEYRFLSNFWPSPIVYRTLRFGTVEEAYQWEKCATIEGKTAILLADNPGRAKMIGKKYPTRQDWGDVKLMTMLNLLELKFEIPYLREKLLETGDETLVEGNVWNDTFWGVCNGTGQNHLGKLLMNLREEIRG